MKLSSIRQAAKNVPLRRVWQTAEKQAYGGAVYRHAAVRQALRRRPDGLYDV